MIIDGRVIAAEIYAELKNKVSHLDSAPHLTVFTCAPNFETQKFLALKKRKAEEVGIAMNVIEFPADITTNEVVQSVVHAQMQTDGIVVQLPFPEAVNVDEVFKSIPASYDVDVMQYDGTTSQVLPPVVGAIQEMVDRHDIMLAAQKVVVVGRGKLVGAPAAMWAMKQGAQVSVVTEETADRAVQIAAADILILGAGQPKLVQPEHIKDGVIIFDAGTSEEGGVLMGDADPACIQKASFITPVPGGIGPVTVAVLLRNLVRLATKDNSK